VSSTQGTGAASQDPAKEGGVLVSSDPPLHTFERAAWCAFPPDDIAAMEPDIREICLKLVDDIAPTGRGDIMADLAVPSPKAGTRHRLR